MSGYKTHFLMGLFVTAMCGLAVFYGGFLDFTPYNLGWMLLICFIFSLLPDVDIGTSIIRKVLLIAFIVFIFINGIGPIGYILGAIIIIIQFLPHRGIMHSFIMGILLSGLLYFYFHNWVFPIIALVNFVSHLSMDKCL
jgi:membrane-bound metal-dependent hydrolase YbcI (DUF457 family)